MKYTEEVYETIATKQPSLTREEIDAKAESYIMKLVKDIDENVYNKMWKNGTPYTGKQWQDWYTNHKSSDEHYGINEYTEMHPND